MPLKRIWVKSRNEEIYCAIHQSVDFNPKAFLIIIPPFGEEKKSCQKTFVDIANYLSTKGYWTIRFDYAGTGDSTGNLCQMLPEDWIANTRDIVKTAQGLYEDVPVILIGVRFGALISLEITLKTMSCNYCILLDPILDLRQYYTALKRQQFALNLLTKGSAKTIFDMTSETDKKGFFDFYGYVTSLEFWSEALKTFQFENGCFQEKYLAIIVREGDRQNLERKAKQAVIKYSSILGHTIGKFWEMNRKSYGKGLGRVILDVLKEPSKESQ